jgi:hypothetical protein
MESVNDKWYECVDCTRLIHPEKTGMFKSKKGFICAKCKDKERGDWIERTLDAVFGPRPTE